MPANVRHPAKSAFRPDIQALRAVAVAAVVLFHLRPSWLSGGYVGVDVFFVISGFLITSHLVREHSGSGRINLLRFYERRVRRLLPAALLVLMAILVAYLTLMPESTRRQGFLELIASALYGENWVLAFSSVDYLGAAAAPSLVQHYWSLSVEEQFYILWPMALIVVGLIARLVRLHARPRVWFAALGAVFVASLVFSVTITAANPAWAYFVTPARAWEFAAGGLIALSAGRLVTAPERHPVISTIVSWVGLAAIVASAMLFTDATPFPGSAALLPVLGTALVIAAGNPATAWSPMVVGGTRVIQFIGGISYSVYLWHWPLIVLFSIVFGREPGMLAALAIVAITVLLATLSKYFVEDPFLRRRTHMRRVWPSFAAAAAAMVVIVVVASMQVSQIDRRIEIAADEQVALAGGPCFRAQSLDSSDCGDPREAPDEIDTVFASSDFADTSRGDCGAGAPIKQIGDSVECSFGDNDSDNLVVMIGDSHSDHWLPAMQAIGEKRGWHIVTLFRSSCPFTEATPTASGVFQEACEQWKDLAKKRIAELEPSLVFVASLTPYGYAAADFDVGPLGAMQQGYVNTLTSTVANSGSVVVIRDTPFMGDNIPNCLETSSRAGECERTTASVLDAHVDPLWDAAEQVDGVARVDLTDAFCDSVTCFPVTGGVVIYRDHHHIGASYSRSLAPRLLAEISELVPQLP